MLKKKTGFKPKPKAIGRRNAPLPSQEASQLSTAERHSDAAGASSTTVAEEHAPQSSSELSVIPKSHHIRSLQILREVSEAASGQLPAPHEEYAVDVDQFARGKVADGPSAEPSQLEIPQPEDCSGHKDTHRHQTLDVDQVVFTTSASSFSSNASPSNLAAQPSQEESRKQAPTSAQRVVTTAPSASPAVVPDPGPASCSAESIQNHVKVSDGHSVEVQNTTSAPARITTAKISQPSQTAMTEESPRSSGEDAPAITPLQESESGGTPPIIKAAAQRQETGRPERPKPKRARKRKATATTGAGIEDLQVREAATPARKRARVRSTAAMTTEGSNEKNQRDTPDSRTRNRAQRGVRKRPAQMETDAKSGADEAVPPLNKQARHRSVTPENAEGREIDTSTVTMADLAKDLRIGKKHSMHDELKERAKKRRLANQRRRALKKLGMPVPSAEQEEAATGTPAPVGADTQNQANETTRGPFTAIASLGFKVQNGEIVVDPESLQIDRHARAAAEAGELEEEEENEFTRHITSATYLRRKTKPNYWSDVETELFYTALESFGTDFETISKLFPDKKRRHIKLKFNREERERPNRIDAALVGEKHPMMNVEEFQRLTGLKLIDTAIIDAEHHKAEEEFEARQKEMDEAEAEAQRKKEEELYGASKADAAAGDEKAAAAGRKAGEGAEAEADPEAIKKKEKKKKKKKPKTGFSF